MGGFNPVVSGLINGYTLAHQMNSQRQAQEQIDRQSARDAEDKQVRDLQTRLALDADGAIAAKARGVKQQASADRIAEETALVKAKGEAGDEALKKKMQLLGVPLSDAKADEYGVPRGTKLLQGPGFGTELGALMRGANKGAAAGGADEEVQHSYLSQGNLITVGKKGTVKVHDLGLPPEAAKRQPGSLTDYQRYRIGENNRARLADHQAAQQAVNGYQVEINRLNAEEQTLHQANTEIGQSLNSGVNVRTKAEVTAGDAEDLHSELAANVKAISALQAKQALHKQAQNAVLMKFAGKAAMAGYGASEDGGADAADAGDSPEGAAPAGLKNPY